jgi:hypothetical protein
LSKIIQEFTMSGWLDKRGGLEATKVTEIAVDESRISCTVIRSELMTSSLYPFQN